MAEVSKATELIVVRHAETVWNRESRQQRWDDTELTELGAAQTQAVAEGLAALQGTEAVGMASLKVRDMDGQEELSPWMAGLYVAQEYRRQETGTLLIEASLKEAQRLGIGPIYLWTAGLDEYYAKRRWDILEQVAYKGEEVTTMKREGKDGRFDF